MYCKTCGNDIPQGKAFCSKCGTPVDHEIQKAEVVEKKTGSKKGVAIGIISVVVVVAIIVIAAFVSANMITKEMRNALETNNAELINEIYSQAWNDPKMLEKYDDLIVNRLDEILEDIKSCDFSESAKENGDFEYEDYICSKWGDFILYPDDFSDDILTRHYDKFKEYFDLVEAKEAYYIGIHYYTTGDYESAINNFAEAIEYGDDFSDAEDYISDSISGYISVVSENAQVLIDSGDISGGIELLTSAKEYVEQFGVDSTEINDKINSTLSTYAAQYAEKAEAVFIEHDVEGAIGNIEVAIELQPNNAEYKTKLDTYKLYLPFELYYEKNVLMIEDAGVYFAEENEVDVDIANDNSEMYNTMGLYSNSDFAEFTYNLNGQYDLVSGTAFVKKSKKSEKGEGYFEAYGDGVLIYTSPIMSAGVLPQFTEFNVTGVHKLTIKMYGQRYGIGFEISDFIAQKSLP